MNDIEIFNNDRFGEIRVMGTPDKPMFCLADVCRALDLGNPSQVKTRLDNDGVIINEGVVQTVSKADGTEVQQMGGMTYIDEPNLYRCIFQSRKPEAKNFQNWVYGEVLPSIRKTGRYSIYDELEDVRHFMHKMLHLIDARPNNDDWKRGVFIACVVDILGVPFNTLTEMAPIIDKAYNHNEEERG